MVMIASDSGKAKEAVSAMKAISVDKSEEVKVNFDSVDAMTNGAEVNNRLLSDLNKVVDCIQKQSDKFPQIAQIIEETDSNIEF